MRLLTTLTDLFHRLSDEEGATAVEYAILAGLIACVVVVAVTAFGLNVLGLFTSSTARITDATS